MLASADDLPHRGAHSNFYRYVAGVSSSISECRSLLGVSRCDATITSVIWHQT